MCTYSVGSVQCSGCMVYGPGAMAAISPFPRNVWPRKTRLPFECYYHYWGSSIIRGSV